MDQPGRPMTGRPREVHFGGPDGMKINWDVNAPGVFGSERWSCPANHDFRPGVTYRLKLSNIPGRPGLEFYPTLEVAATVPQTEAYLAYHSIPLAFTPEDFDQVTSGNFVAKVVYLPDPAFQELALDGIETMVSTRPRGPAWIRSPRPIAGGPSWQSFVWAIRTCRPPAGRNRDKRPRSPPPRPRRPPGRSRWWSQPGYGAGG